MSHNVLIADDHPLFREALKQIVRSAAPDAQVLEAQSYAQVREHLKAAEFDIIFVDLDMPDSSGLSELVLLKKLAPTTPIVVVSAHESDSIISTCLFYGAKSYIVKSTHPADIQAAVKTLLNGGDYLPANYKAVPVNEGGAAGNSALSSLTPSQLQVLFEIGKGKLNKQIAYDLEVTEATVKAHITNIFKKLGINNRTQAVLIAREHSVSLSAPK